ncbi:MAG TPA: DUF58 domain-containing protein [Candidatus Omnitrophota bacterium]|nr:DUF58 domain-containing protein [Candidatus Omnitrophota bacterium]HPT39150.1 DUF58 domain-containing protein [Candidatus Omnitrophota bacterium]
MLKSFRLKWLVLGFFFISSLLIGLKTTREFFFFFTYFLLSATAVSLVWLLLTYFTAHLQLSRKVISRVTEGEILEVTAEISNTSFFPVFNFVLEDNFSCVQPDQEKKDFFASYLGPKSASKIQYNYLCFKRGEYKIGPFAVYFFDPLNLFFFKRTFYIYSAVVVYPKIFRIEKFPALTRSVLPWFGIETARSSGDDDEFYGVREYKEGESVKKIHWISSARKNKLIVKQFQLQSFFGTTIMFNLEKAKNLGEGKESVAEYIIKIAASVAHYLTEKGVSIELLAHIGEIVHLPFNKGEDHLENILRILAVAQAESRISFREAFEEFARYIPNDSSLVVVMSDQDYTDLPHVISLYSRGISLIPLIIVSDTFLPAADKKKTARQAKIKVANLVNMQAKFFSQGDNLTEVFI